MSKRAYLQYMLYATVCIVSILIALIVVWWFSQKRYSKEDFVVASPYIVMVGLTTDGVVYYADIDVPMSPKWLISQVTGVPVDIAGGTGTLCTLDAFGSLTYGNYDSTQLNLPGYSSVKFLSIDDNQSILSTTSSGAILFSQTPTGTPAALSGISGNKVAANGGAMFVISSAGALSYYPSTNSASTAVPVTVPGVTSWTEICFDGGVVCALDNAGNIWCADTNINASTANWKKQGTKQFKQVSLKGGRLVGVAKDNITYYSNSYSSPSWTALPMVKYDLNTGVPSPGAPALSFQKVIMMYPSLDARRKRFVAGTTCNDDEQMIGNFCYQPCTSGRPAVGAKCPYRRAHTDAIAACPTGTDYINGSCYQPCTAGTASGDKCVGITTPKEITPKNTDITDDRYDCPAGGVINARYVRVRPTNLIQNNKLCISRINIRDANGVNYVNSGLKTFATDGTCLDAPLGGMSCASQYSTYLSGTSFDSDPDGGKLSRGSKLYWEVDLGSIKPIKTIDFTGCRYVPFSATNTGPTETTSQPNADQITGMSIELYGLSNSLTTTPIAVRTLGADINQTITFNYVKALEPELDNRCYDACPPMNGVPSVLDYNSETCVATQGGMTMRSITSPLSLPDPVCGPPTFAVTGTNRVIIGPNTVQNWTLDPQYPEQYLSCDAFPNTTLTPFSTTFYVPIARFKEWVPNPNTRFSEYMVSEDNNITDPTTNKLTINLMYSNGTQVPNTGRTSMMCVKQDNSLCPTGFVLTPGFVCQNNTPTEFYAHFKMQGNGGGQIYYGETWTNLGSGVILPPLDYTSAGACTNPNTKYVGIDAGNTYGTVPLPYKHFRGPLHIGATDITEKCYQNIPKYVVDLVYGDQPTVTANYRAPLIPNQSIFLPTVAAASCRCLNSDLTVNKGAYIYDGKCVKCSSRNDLFYPKGVTQSSYNWSTEQKGKWLTAEDERGILVDPNLNRFTDIDAAKKYCETFSKCTGITKSFDNTGEPFYTIRGGKNLLDATSPQSGSSRFFFTANDSSWQILPATLGNTAVQLGKAPGTTFSTEDIPRPFADDYLSAVAGAASGFTKPPGASYTEAINYLTSAMLQVASAWSIFQDSAQNTNNYYQQTGMERVLSSTYANNDKGICVGPCDSEHTLSDPIQMTKNTVSGLYTLYGTVCYNPSKIRFNRPSIPALYTPQIGSDCDDGQYVSGSSCTTQCPASSSDTGSSCISQTSPRPFITPTYTCARSVQRIDRVCVEPCGPGYTEDSDYCIPNMTYIPVPSSINCSMGGAASSGSGANKWFCDSSDDMNALLEGPTDSSITPGTQAYVNTGDANSSGDTLCYADDPTTGMYYCQTAKDLLNGVTTNQSENLSKSCDNLAKSYMDLSNNLTILMNTKTTANNASAQIAAVQATLQTLIGQMCSTSSSEGSSSSCVKLRQQLLMLGSNIGSGTGLTSGIMSPIAAATTSRDQLIAMLRNLKCCSAGQSGYPWC